MLSDQLGMLTDRQRATGLDCVALVPGPNLRYMSGLSLFISERPIVVFFPVDTHPLVLLPAFEQGRAEKMAQGRADFIAYTDQEGFAEAFRCAADTLALDGKRIAVESLHMRAIELWQLRAVAPTAQFVSLEETLPGLRMIKDPAEIEMMRKAIAITEQALHDLIAHPVTGLTERQVTGCLRRAMLDAGADDVAFIIVVAGPNGADPHAGPSDRPVQAGDLMTIDCGARYNGYSSDITRTFAVGHVDPKLREVYEVVQRANTAGKARIKPGVSAQDVDRAARQAIVQAGYGDRFTHRTGHGLGLEVHEPPYIVEGNEQKLQAGMVFTIEPGLYLPGLGGVRIEDNVVVTSDGVDCLTTFPREWTAIE